MFIIYADINTLLSLTLSPSCSSLQTPIIRVKYVVRRRLLSIIVAASGVLFEQFRFVAFRLRFVLPFIIIIILLRCFNMVVVIIVQQYRYYKIGIEIERETHTKRER